MRAPAASCGTTNTRRTPAARSAIAASACTATGCSSKRPTATWSAWTRRTGKERWKVRIADPKLDYTSTVAPVVVGNHILVGIGGDHLDNPGFLESRDPETGALQWKWWTTPRKGEPGIETWPDEHAAAHGTGHGVDSRHLRSRAQPVHRGHRQSQSGDGREEPQGRQPLHLLDCGAQSGHRQAGLVFPALAARHARLGCGRDAGDLRRNDRRAAAQAGGAGQPQRLLLCARSGHRQTDCDRADASIR